MKRVPFFISLLGVVVFGSFNDLTVYAQDQKEPEINGIFYKKSVIPRDVIFLPFLGYGYTAFSMKNESRLIEKMNDNSTGAKIHDLSPGGSFHCGFGFFIPYANTRVMIEYQKEELSNTNFNLFGGGSSFYLTHDMNIYLFQIEKLFQLRISKNTPSSAYTGLGAGIILLSDTRSSSLDYKYSLGPTETIKSKLKTGSYLGVINLVAGKFNTTTGSVFMEVRAGYQFTISTSILGATKPGFNPSDYSPDLNAFRVSVLFGIVI